MDRWSEVDEQELGWLIDACGQEVTGFGPPPYPAGLWIPHAMYEAETEVLAAHRRAQDEDEADKPVWPADPGPGWRRLRWHELAERTGDPVAVQHVAAVSRAVVSGVPFSQARCRTVGDDQMAGLGHLGP